MLRYLYLTIITLDETAIMVPGVFVASVILIDEYIILLLTGFMFALLPTGDFLNRGVKKRSYFSSLTLPTIPLSSITLIP